MKLKIILRIWIVTLTPSLRTELKVEDSNPFRGRYLRNTVSIVKLIMVSICNPISEIKFNKFTRMKSR